MDRDKRVLEKILPMLTFPYPEEVVLVVGKIRQILLRHDLDLADMASALDCAGSGFSFEEADESGQEECGFWSGEDVAEAVALDASCETSIDWKSRAASLEEDLKEISAAFSSPSGDGVRRSDSSESTT